MTWAELRAEIATSDVCGGRTRERQRRVRVLLRDLGACRGGAARASVHVSIREAFDQMGQSHDLIWWLNRVWSIRASSGDLDAARASERLHVLRRAVAAVFEGSRIPMTRQEKMRCRAIRRLFNHYGDLR